MLRSVVALISLAALDLFHGAATTGSVRPSFASRNESEAGALDSGSITKHLPSTAQRLVLPPLYCSSSHLIAIELRADMEVACDFLIFEPPVLWKFSCPSATLFRALGWRSVEGRPGLRTSASASLETGLGFHERC